MHSSPGFWRSHSPSRCSGADRSPSLAACSCCTAPPSFRHRSLLSAAVLLRLRTAALKELRLCCARAPLPLNIAASPPCAPPPLCLAALPQLRASADRDRRAASLSRSCRSALLLCRVVWPVPVLLQSCWLVCPSASPRLRVFWLSSPRLWLQALLASCRRRSSPLARPCARVAPLPAATPERLRRSLLPVIYSARACVSLRVRPSRSSRLFALLHRSKFPFLACLSLL